MKSLSSIGLGLSVLFGCLLLALVAEIYYLLWWKKRLAGTDLEDNYSNPAKDLLYTFCWKRPPTLNRSAIDPQEMYSSARVTDNPDAEFQHTQSPSKDLFLKPFGEGNEDAELMDLHNLVGPPRFLFTIAEETKDDLESEDGKSRTDSSNNHKREKESRRLSDFLLAVETPYLTPLASPPFLTPPLTPLGSSYSPHRFNPLFESLTDAEFNRIRSSPPPKFKFLQDAEEKLRIKLMEEAEKKADGRHGINQKEDGNASSKFPKEGKTESFIAITVDKSRDKELNHPQSLSQHPSSTSQVTPLASSPLSIQNSNLSLTRSRPG